MSITEDSRWGEEAPEYPSRDADADLGEIAEGLIAPDLLATWLDAISEVNFEAPFEFDDEGVHVAIVNDSKTVQLRTTLHPPAFQQFRSSESGERIASVDALRDMCRIADADADERVGVTVGEEGAGLFTTAGPVSRTVACYDSLSNLRASEASIQPSFRAAVDRQAFVRAVRIWRTPYRAGKVSRVPTEFNEFAATTDGQLELRARSDIDEVATPNPRRDELLALKAVSATIVDAVIPSCLKTKDSKLGMKNSSRGSRPLATAPTNGGGAA